MLWIVCACFFDVPSFKKLRLEGLKSLQGNPLRPRFILLDDSAGTDPEIEGLQELSDVEVLRLPYNMGHQAALVYGLRKLGERVAESDFVLTLDSDGEDRPQDIPAMLSPLLAQPGSHSRVALAWRTERKETPLFKLGYFFFKLAFRLLTGEVIKNGNYAAYRGWLLKEIIHHPHFDQCYASSFISLPLQIHFVPLPRGPRYFGQSKMNRGALLTHGLRMLMPFTERIATRGLVVSVAFAAISAVVFVLALAVSTFAAILAFLCAFAFAMVAGLFVLLFATFSQAKAASVKRARPPGAFPGRKCDDI